MLTNNACCSNKRILDTRIFALQLIYLLLSDIVVYMFEPDFLKINIAFCGSTCDVCSNQHAVLLLIRRIANRGTSLQISQKSNIAFLARRGSSKNTQKIKDQINRR